MIERFSLLILTFIIFSCSTDDSTINERELTSGDIEIEYINLDFTIRDIEFLDENIGYIIDDNGGISKTNNSGQEWIELYRSDIELIDIKFLNNDLGFVLGKSENNFHLLKTENAGASFEEEKIEEGSGLRKIYFLDSNTGFALGNHILRTTDGGKVWTELSLDFNVYNDLIELNQTIYACGLRGTFLKSEDIGNNWEKIDLKTNSHLYSIIPIQNQFYLFAQNILKTDLTNSQEFSIPDISSSHVFDKETIVGFGKQYPEQEFYPNGAIFISNNSGKDWNTNLYNEFNRIRVVDFIDQSNGYGIADNLFAGKEYLIKIKIE